MTYADEARARAAHLDIAGRHPGLIDPFKVAAAEVPEPLGAPDPEEETGLTSGLCDAAVRDLAEKHHKTLSEVDSLLRLTAQRADLGRSPGERAAVITEVDRALSRGLTEPDREQILSLSRGQADYGEAEADRILWLAAEPGNGDESRLTMALSASAGSAELARHAALYGESADAITARYPEFFGR